MEALGLDRAPLISGPESGDVLLIDSKTNVKSRSSKISESLRSLRSLKMGSEGDMRG